ncbi:MATE family efflux transporter [Eubacterium aggregans]|uniref:MATE family efflux transporter n=1 Tax=Eubacterium aggregans TaxID=81409 RepID=UPI0023F0AAFF|nr:MATE family efflux transporter [Eubacterium aggregans]MDD4692409.1 MATE family efflux transporter [Eubacterium aggregans]
MPIRLSDHFSYRRLLRFVLPTIIMMIVASVYSVVDGFFVSNVLGKNAFAAVNLMMPVVMALGSFGFMIGTGGSALIAKTLGEGDERRAKDYFTMLICVVVMAGIVLSTIGFIFMPQIADSLGASDAIIEDAIVYGRTFILGNTFFMLQNSFQSFLVAAEKPQMGLVISLMAGITNIVLDFLLISVWGLGVFGAAMATIIGQAVGGLIPLMYFWGNRSSRLCFVKARMDFSALGKACVNGSSEMLTNLSVSVVGMLYNIQLIGSAPVIGYHYGAKNMAELKSLFIKSLVITGAVSLIMTLLAEAFALPLSKLFVGYDAELLGITVKGMRLYALSFLLCGFNIFGSAFFTALNNGGVSALISFLRTLVFQVAAILVLPLVLGIDGIWLAIVVAESLTLFVTLGLFIKYQKRYHYA